MVSKVFVYIRGAGELASAVIHRLHVCGFHVVASEVSHPLAVRRYVSFCECVRLGHEYVVEGVTAINAPCTREGVEDALSQNKLPIVVDPKGKLLSEMQFDVLIDATISKRNIAGTQVGQGGCPLVIGLGPGLVVGQDVDVVIETNRGHHLGRVFWGKGDSAAPDTGVPGVMNGVSHDRLLRAPCSGTVRDVDGESKLGEVVENDEIVCYIDETPVRAKISGLVRGLLPAGVLVEKNLKLGDIDPRQNSHSHLHTISDKARTISGGVLEAILTAMNRNIVKRKI